MHPSFSLFEFTSEYDSREKLFFETASTLCELLVEHFGYVHRSAVPWPYALMANTDTSMSVLLNANTKNEKSP